MKFRQLQEPVRVVLHLNEGYTRVILERTIGVGMADGGIEWDVRTEVIQLHLRKIGSRFTVVLPSICPDEQDSIEELKQACSQVEIQEIIEPK